MNIDDIDYHSIASTGDFDLSGDSPTGTGDGASLPTWIQKFRQLVEGVPPLDEIETDVSDPEPFHEIHAGIAASAIDRCGPVETERFDGVFEQFRRYLIDRLSVVSSKALFDDFRLFLTTTLSESELDELDGDSSRYYDRYVAKFYAGRGQIFFETYPVLARHVTTIVGQWIQILSEFANRFHADIDDIRRLPGIDGDVKATDVTIQENSTGGECVILVQLGRGEEVVYKDRDLSLERELYDFIAWGQTELERIPSQRIPQVVTKDEYGWMEALDQTTIDTREALATYFERSGALMCLLCVLNANDCHHQNIIAAEEAPVFVDAETVFNPKFINGIFDNYGLATPSYLPDSRVLASLFVPYHVGKREIKGTTFGTTSPTESPRRRLIWTNVNTDSMSYEYEHVVLRPESNLPLFDGAVADPAEFVANILEGYETMYRCLQQHSEQVIEQIERRFDGVTVRAIPFKGRKYEQILQTATNPEFLKDGTDHRRKIETMLESRMASLEMRGSVEEINSFLTAERDALLDREVPTFHVNLETGTVTESGSTVCSLPEEGSVIDETITSLRELSESQLSRHKAIIGASLSDEKLLHVNADGTVSISDVSGAQI